MIKIAVQRVKIWRALQETKKRMNNYITTNKLMDQLVSVKYSVKDIKIEIIKILQIHSFRNRIKYI